MSTIENQFEVNAESGDKGLRCDRFLCKKLPDFSRAQINRLIKSGHILLNAKPIKSSQAVNGHETFSVTIPQAKKCELEPKKIPIDILFSDDQIALINKPKGLVVHPGAGENEETLCHALLHYFPDMQVGDSERPGIVHRLDKNTSGVMVIAKTHDAHKNLCQAFKDRLVSKKYFLICWGEPEQKQFELVTGHVRHPYHPLKFFTGIQPPSSSINSVRVAHTKFTIIKSKYGISLIEAELFTGRTHQIRAHLADIGHPLVGDKLYGPNRNAPKIMPDDLKKLIEKLEGQALHAETLELSHPISKKNLKVSAQKPKNLENICQYLE